MVPANELAEIADKFTRNEIMSSNEMRQIIGLKPSEDPRADELRNKNLNEANNGIEPPMVDNPYGEEYSDEEYYQNGSE